MEIIFGPEVSGYGCIGLTRDVTIASNLFVELKVEVWFWSKYSVTDTANTLYYDKSYSAISGYATTSKGSVSIQTKIDSGSGWSSSNQQKIATYTHTIPRETSDTKMYIGAKLVNVDRVGGEMVVWDWVTIPARPSYTVTYNANGGTGAPSNQTKYDYVPLTLSTTKPTRTGYTFQGWSTANDSTVEYAAGASYTADAAVTLYAVWKANTYSVKYDANGGTGAPSAQTKTYGVTLKLSSTKPTRPDHTFKGWGVSASSTTVSYASGANYTNNAAITLYAIWERNYFKPRITNLSIARCDSSGVSSEEGTYGLISFKWECDATLSSITVEWKLPSVSAWSSASVSASGTSGTSSKVIGNGALSVESSYDIRVTVTDASGSSYVLGTLTSMLLAFDALAGGKGVSFGKTAELEGVAEFEFDGKFNKPVYGKALGMDRLPAIPANSDFNNYRDPGCYAVQSNALAATCVNIPIDRAGRLEVWSATGEGVRSEQWSYLRQRFVPYNSSNAVWEREITRSADNIWKYYDWWRTSLTPTASDKVYHEQKVLWGSDMSSGMYMTAGHTATLTETVSAQPNGIVLVFSAYNSADDSNFGWETFFVPKQLVALSTAGHTFILGRGRFTYTGTKYLYIYDNRIEGHADNNATGTSNGITYNNSKFVLRYVIGV